VKSRKISCNHRQRFVCPLTVRVFRAAGFEIKGGFHSHPNGSPQLFYQKCIFHTCRRFFVLPTNFDWILNLDIPERDKSILGEDYLPLNIKGEDKLLCASRLHQQERPIFATFLPCKYKRQYTL